MTLFADSTTTMLLKRWSEGDEKAFAELDSHVRDELRRLAAHYMRGERSGHILQVTALIQEAYLKLLGSSGILWANRSHFIGIMANKMREVLVDYARRSLAEKRGGGARLASLEDKAESFQVSRAEAEWQRQETERRMLEVVAVHQALDELGAINPRQKEIVLRRYYAGMSIAQTAADLDISPATVMREFDKAKNWLCARLIGGSAEERAAKN